MSVEIITIPCLIDNYAYIIHEKASNKNTLVDAPASEPIMAFLNALNWKLDSILITHHHNDHIEGIQELTKKFNPIVYGAKADAYRLPKLDVELEHRDKFSASNLVVKCLEVPGHTIGHIAFYLATENILFSGDSLMTLGCGRLFEGTAEDMMSSLDSISSLPENTEIYSGHEYAKQNAKFALTIEPHNELLKERAKEISKNIELKRSNVPVSLKTEKETNPFLRCDTPEIMKLPIFKNKNKLEIFSTLRQMKDTF